MRKVYNSIRFYNRVAPVYNFCLDWIFNPGRKKVASVLNKTNKSILDIGCGTGNLTKFLIPSKKYLGIDGAPKMIKKAKKKHPNFQFESTSFESYESDSKVECITLLYLISTVNNPAQLLKKCHQLLRKDGQLIIVNHFSPNNIFYKALQKTSPLVGYNAYFPFNENLFEPYFKITKFESVNLLGNWKYIELTPIHE